MSNGTIIGKGIALVLATAALVSACGQGASTTLGGAEPGEGIPLGLVRLEVDGEHVECMGFIPQTCVGVRDTAGGYEWSVYDWEIDGIVLEEGSSYVLDVRIEERDEYLADASSITYELEEIVEVTGATGA